MSIRTVDLTGFEFNGCKVIGLDDDYKNKRVRAWRCACFCGNYFSETTSKIRSKYRKSCGCIQYKKELKNDLTGNRYGMITVSGFSHITDSGNYMYRVKCDCGSEKLSSYANLTARPPSSCGCAHNVADYTSTHGMSGTRTYRSWAKMKERCNNEKCISYPFYGEIGIKVCDEWNNSFESFLYSMGEAPEGMSIDRIDNDKGYYPDNCRWATKTQQSANRRSVKGAASKYKGVFVVGDRFRAVASHNGKNYHIGYFINEDDAARAYDIKAYEIWGEYANLNFKKK